MENPQNYTVWDPQKIGKFIYNYTKYIEGPWPWRRNSSLEVTLLLDPWKHRIAQQHGEVAGASPAAALGEQRYLTKKSQESPNHAFSIYGFFGLMLKHHKPEATLDAPGINTGMFSHRDSCTLRWISISLDIELAIQNLPSPHPFKSKLFGAWRTDVVWTADVLATLILGGAGGKRTGSSIELVWHSRSCNSRKPLIYKFRHISARRQHKHCKAVRAWPYITDLRQASLKHIELQAGP